MKEKLIILKKDEELSGFVKQVNFPLVYVGTPEFYHERKDNS